MLRGHEDHQPPALAPRHAVQPRRQLAVVPVGAVVGLGEKRERQERLLRLPQPIEKFKVFPDVGGRQFALDFHSDPPLGPRLKAGSIEHVKYGFIAEFADLECMISIVCCFLPRLV